MTAPFNKSEFMRQMNLGRAHVHCPALLAYDARRKAKAMPRWRKVAEMRDKGMKFWEIAKRLRLREATVFRMDCRYREEILKQHRITIA